MSTDDRPELPEKQQIYQALREEVARLAPPRTSSFLTARTARALMREDISTLDQLRQFVEREGWDRVRRIYNIGNKAVALIAAVLRNAGEFPDCPQCARQQELEAQIAETQRSLRAMLKELQTLQNHHVHPEDLS